MSRRDRTFSAAMSMSSAQRTYLMRATRNMSHEDLREIIYCLATEMLTPLQRTDLFRELHQITGRSYCERWRGKRADTSTQEGQRWNLR
jgi:hypothetical protein